ncbi:MerR family DNA-binding transcriptional regulator [uncultured Marinobacter sp.]|uniref:MerR family transcriptional regulator n=1 Tax=uncultured Marinobacter sp. TaxID=187379 RepID=UPI0026262FFB|nr:MerR family DNA-binding transcriptional regulator [uncultured Marinobacter sp.]
MAEEKRTYSISELAKEFDVTTRSVRFYEDQGLLKPSRRGQTRIFSSKDRVRLKLILRGKRMGFSLAETKELFDLWDETLTGNEKQLLKMLTILDNKRAQLEQQKNDIAQAEMEMDTAEARCREALADLQKRKRQQKGAEREAPASAEQK